MWYHLLHEPQQNRNVAAMLMKQGIRATVYHAGLSSDMRDKAQNDFINDRVQVVCATIAFGMELINPMYAGLFIITFLKA